MSKSLAHALKKQEHRQLSIAARVYNFWALKRSRFAWLVILGLIQYYDLPGRSYRWVVKKRKNVGLKYLRRWQI